jgi:hypothetical protein
LGMTAKPAASGWMARFQNSQKKPPVSQPEVSLGPAGPAPEGR